MFAANPHLARFGFGRALIRELSSPPNAKPPIFAAAPGSLSLAKCRGFRWNTRRFGLRQSLFTMAATDEDSAAISTFIEESNGACEGTSSYVMLSESEESDTEPLAYPSVDSDLPRKKHHIGIPDAAITMATHTFAYLQQGYKKRRIRTGIMINTVLIAFLGVFLLIFDWCSWRVVRLPLKPFFLTRPFILSAILSACVGFLYVPIVDGLKIHQILRKEGPSTHSSKKGTPTMGGLFFIPIGIIVSGVTSGQTSIQLCAAALATLAFAAIGLLDDLLSCVKCHNYGLTGWMKLNLQKFLVPLPPPFGLVFLGKLYLVLTAFCFAAMGNGVNLTDGLDGLAGGVAAFAFIGMSAAVLAICPELSVFGASMAGACVGFLFHNRHKASIFMGDTGSLGLGGALAAMAACTGMFFPLFLSSGVIVMEVLSVIVQVLYKKATERLYGTRRCFFRMAPLHHHFELCGWKEPVIVASAYVVSCILALFAGYVGLISA